MVKLEEHKYYTYGRQIERMPLASNVYLPLIQHLGKACIPQVKIGDYVLTGQKIASIDAKVYSPIHASISGKVSAIADYPHPVLGRCRAIAIESDGRDELSTASRTPSTVARPDELTAEQIRDIVLESGIVGLGGAGFPTHIKLNPSKTVSHLIINGAECEPYLTSDYRLMVEKTREIVLGIDLVARCLGVKYVYIAIEDNKPLAIEAFRSMNSERLTVNGERLTVDGCVNRTHIQVVILKTEYPQGGEKQLIKKILGREVPRGGLPFDVGAVVHNVATCFAIYEAVYLNKPLYERVVTVTGSCLTSPRNLMVRLGTPIRDLIEFCGPLKDEPAKIIIGGPMMGIAQYTDKVPVIKTTSGVILMNKDEAKIFEEMPCIRCGSCIRNCPIGLMPCLINLASGKELWSFAKTYGALDCIECGCCNYVCPANRHLVQSIKRAKLEIGK